MQNPRDILTPEALAMLQTIGSSGSFAAAARVLGLVPSALTYRVRQIEDALDVLLFDRSAKQAQPTAAGQALLQEAGRLLSDVDAVANRIKRVATGWEAVLTVAADSIISRTVLMELCEAFLALKSPTRLRLRHETLLGTLNALTSGQADLALGVLWQTGLTADIQHLPLGPVEFVFAVAPHHPLAAVPEPLSEELRQQHRVVAVADSVPRGSGLSIGLLGGQDVFTVPDMQSKLEAQLRGLGAGFLPLSMALPYISTGRLVAKEVTQSQRTEETHYAWRNSRKSTPAKALQWWLVQLQSETTQLALLQPQYRV
ncbi:LysR family transcriptional regulator [Limnohabitans sp. Rim8]|uniref:LysR family transcriptional regulator n=1 Tax=Limnohabitans sp. Rim8 TaxID=1100718 RepID=UPI0026081FB3|nr:LysR family transcriptional regulator [Limnohabitans sp. Rim8]